MRAAQGAERRERGYFDPELFLRLNHLDQEIPTSSPFAGAEVLKTEQSTYQGGVRLNLPIGTQLELAMTGDQLKTNSAFASLNPQYTSFGSLSIRQPLLGGFAASGRKELSKAEEEQEAGSARYNQQLIAVSADVERAYWDLYAAERDFAVQMLTRDRAEAFLKDTETRARTGLIGPNQVANARTFLAEQEILLLDREEQLDYRFSDALSSTIGRRPDSGKARFSRSTSPPRQLPGRGPADVLVEQAPQKENLSLQAAKAEVEARRALAKAALWEALPKLDLVASLGGNGLAGTPRDVIFNNDIHCGRRKPRTRMGDAMSQALKHQFPAWSVGVEFTLPILLRRGLGGAGEARGRRGHCRSAYCFNTLARILEEEVRASYRELSHGKRQPHCGEGGC